MRSALDGDVSVKLEILYGHIEIVTTERRVGDKLILGGYSIHYDRDGRETRRTEDTPSVIVTLPDEMCRPWWRFW